MKVHYYSDAFVVICVLEDLKDTVIMVRLNDSILSEKSVHTLRYFNCINSSTIH